MTLAELDAEAQERLEDLKTRLGWRAVILQGKRPSTLKASMCYLIAKERGFAIMKTRVAEAYRCTTIALDKNVKVLKQLMQQCPEGKNVFRRGLI